MSQNEFTNKADAFLAALPDFGDEQNILADWMEGQAAITQGHAETTTANAAACVQSEQNAAQSAADAANIVNGAANYKGVWGDQTGAATIPATYEHEGGVWLLLQDIPDITASEPGVSSDYLLTTGLKYVEPVVGAVLSTVLINRLTVTASYKYPVASTVQAGLKVTVAILEVDKGITPQVDLQGGDDATDGTNTVSDHVIYGPGFSGLDDAVCNGIDTWEF